MKRSTPATPRTRRAAGASASSRASRTRELYWPRGGGRFASARRTSLPRSSGRLPRSLAVVAGEDPETRDAAARTARLPEHRGSGDLEDVGGHRGQCARASAGSGLPCSPEPRSA
jgi:hypothetical protein